MCIIASVPMSDFSIASGLSEPLSISYTHRTSGVSATEKIAEPFVFFGRHPLNTIQLDDPSVSKKHAYLHVIDGRLFIVDFGSRRGVCIAGERVAESWVDCGQVVEIGDFDIRIEGASNTRADRSLPTSPTLRSNGAQLAIAPTNHPRETTFYPLRSAITFIGQNPQCNYRFVDDRLLHFHAAIVLTQTDAWLVDLLGFGATLLNGSTVRSSQLQSGDTINLNGILFEVQRYLPISSRDQTGSSLEPYSNPESLAPISDVSQPLVHEISEIRQATLFLATLFAEMKQEQTHLMRRQIELMEVMTDVVRTISSREHLSLPAASTSPRDAHVVRPSHSVPTVQTPRIANPIEEEALVQAHNWFSTRLQKLSKPQS
jgi:pSer/pThr/pTyr-binding forkhead associated (FHA) protein